jgi:Ribonuclease G/E|tara:strand:- start:401 stop:577 length:177 start_codon:yes stop_codon:yes gene_type:complete
MEPIALTLGQKFQIEKFSREIDSSKDVQQLRAIAKDLLIAWQQQQAASAWAIRQSQGL